MGITNARHCEAWANAQMCRQHACLCAACALKVQTFHETQLETTAATCYIVGQSCSTPIPPPALLGLDALLSPLALVPLGFLPFLPSAAFMGVLPEQSTFSCTGLNIRGSMRGGRSSSWKLPRLSFVCRLAPVCKTTLTQKLALQIAERKLLLSSCLCMLPVVLPINDPLKFVSGQWYNAQTAHGKRTHEHCTAYGMCKCRWCAKGIRTCHTHASIHQLLQQKTSL